ncbi:hypothetical protein GQ42DRAFT_156070 [Ramicandelaber brevisporus]|nr:hypothetical protein GQ42DRAFT_156070 [Ramicandelaber brevisporus]
MAHNRQYQQGNSHRNSFIGSSAMMDSLGNISGSGGGSDNRRYSQLVAHQGGEFQPPSPSYRHEGGGSGGNSGRGSRRNSLLAAAVTASSNQAHRSSVIYTDYNTGMSPPVYHSGNDSKRQSMIYGGSGDASPLAAGAHYSGPYIGHSRSGSGVTSPLTASQSAGNESIPALNSSVIMNPHQFNASIANMSAYQRHQIQPSDSGSKTLNGSEQTTTSKEGEEDDDDDDNVPVAVIASQQQQQQQLLLQQKRLSHVSTTDVRRSQLLSIPTADQRLSLIEAAHHFP